MAFGFAGAHRTGKTTLAKLVAEDMGYHYHDASVSKIMREAGINAVGDVPMEARIEAQEFLLERFLRDVAKAPRPLITDRTPLDMIGYCLGELTMHNTTPEIGKRFDRYYQSCIAATAAHFDTIFLVGQLPTKYTEDPTKPPPNRGYQTLVQMIVEGSALQVSGSVYCQWIPDTDLQERRKAAKEFLVERMAHLAEESKHYRTH